MDSRHSEPSTGPSLECDRRCRPVSRPERAPAGRREVVGPAAGEDGAVGSCGPNRDGLYGPMQMIVQPGSCPGVCEGAIHGGDPAG